jgi:hypothetical protein
MAALRVLLAGAAALAAAPALNSPLLGAWEYEPTQSTFDGGIPYRSGTLRFEAAPGGIRVSAHIIEGTGRVLHFEYLDRGAGRFERVEGNPFYDSESTRWSASGCVRTERRGTQIIGTNSMQLSADRRSLLARADRSRPDGRRYVSVIAWRRLGPP